MKTIFPFSKMAVILTLFYLFLGTSSKAQVTRPYQILNNTTCTLAVTYNIYERNALGNCAIICNTGNILILPGLAVTVPAWPNYPICGCGIEISIVGVNLIALATPIRAGWPMPPFIQNAVGADPSGCSSTGFINLSVGQGAATVVP